MAAPQIGQTVADFSAQATSGQTIRLADLRGRKLVLYFYPKDSTPGCTTEGQNFRDLIDEFEALGTTILGVSRDSLKSHENFKARQSFPFDLLSDPDETLCQQFDVIRQKKMYGRDVRGIERSTFLIDAEGVLRREWRKVSVKGHAEAVLDAVRELAS